MREDSSGDNNSKKLIMIATVAAAIMMVVTIWWASTLSGSLRTPNAAPLASAAPPPGNIGDSYTYKPPPPLPSTTGVVGRPTARVKITPRVSDDGPSETSSQTDRPRTAPQSRKVGKPREVVRNEVRDMFPVGRVGSRPAESGAGPAVSPSERFPEFIYDGKQWAFTGNLADIEALDIEPTGFQLEGKNVYRLKNTDTSQSVLFVPSSSTPDRVAIYRSVAG